MLSYVTCAESLLQPAACLDLAEKALQFIHENKTEKFDVNISSSGNPNVLSLSFIVCPHLTTAKFGRT